MESIIIHQTFREKVEYAGGNFCVCVGICFGGSTGLFVFLHRILNTQTYRGDILHAYVRTYAGASGNNSAHEEASSITELNSIEEI